MKMLGALFLAVATLLPAQTGSRPAVQPKPRDAHERRADVALANVHAYVAQVSRDVKKGAKLTPAQMDAVRDLQKAADAAAMAQMDYRDEGGNPQDPRTLDAASAKVETALSSTRRAVPITTK